MEEEVNGLKGALESRPTETEAIEGFLEENDEYDVQRREMERYGEEIVGKDISDENLPFNLEDLDRDDFLRILGFTETEEMDYLSDETGYSEEEIEDLLEEDIEELEEERSEVDQKLGSGLDIEKEIEEIEKEIEELEADKSDFQAKDVLSEERKEAIIAEYEEEIEDKQEQKEELETVKEGLEDELRDRATELDEKIHDIKHIERLREEYQEEKKMSRDLATAMLDGFESIDFPIKVSLLDKEDGYEILLPGGNDYGILSYITAESVTRYVQNSLNQNDYDVEEGEYSLSVKIDGRVEREEINSVLENSLINGTPEGMEYTVREISECRLGED